MNNNQQGFNPLLNQDNVMNAIEVLSFVLTVMNLYENRQQSEQNDVQSANDKQARYILNEINKKFDEQNSMIRGIMQDLKIVKRRVSDYEADV